MEYMDPSEIEFLAEREMLSIIPNFSHGKLFLIHGDCGPFIPSIPIQVPVWLALNLRQRQKCRILPPDWMEVDNLEQIKQEETDSNAFTPMPNPYYREVTQMIFNFALSDIPNADKIQTLVQDIWDMRMAKLRSSIDAFIRSGETYAQVDNLTIFEINFVRPLLTSALFELQKLSLAPSNISGQNSQSQSGSLF